MKYMIIGTGGTGGAIGAHLAHAGNDVAFIARGR
ncbi:MAG: oxidoreductase, partial [Mogibacterium sp.]|nr:oxidoreductase [Mogibacterium sp.]